MAERQYPPDWDGPIPRIVGRHPDCHAIHRDPDPESDDIYVIVSVLLGCACPTCAPHDQTDLPDSLDHYLDTEYRALCDSQTRDQTR